MLKSAADRRAAALAAFDRGDETAAAAIAEMLSEAPLDGALLIADATLALEARRPDALDRLSDVLRAAPDWRDGHVALARLRWGAGDEAGFLDALDAALVQLPRHAGLWMCCMDLLAEASRSRAAADTAARLRRQGDTPALRLIEARHAAAAGEEARAARLLAALPDTLPGIALERARLSLRHGDPAAADAQLSVARAAAPEDVALWALTELAWRALDDPRHRALLVPETMIGSYPIDLDAVDRERLVDTLRTIHAKRWPALGQSVRNGTQTRGNLARRAEPVFAAVVAHVEAAAGNLGMGPSARVANAWSIRLTAGGHHVAHVHPAGRISSALHLVVPVARSETRAGALELGRPPAAFDRLGLDALMTIPAVPFRLVLFPSFLYHGTRPIGAGERMSMAFDITA